MKYEYIVIEFEPISSADLKSRLNELGTDGWELVDLDPELHGWHRAIFKRQVS